MNIVSEFHYQKKILKELIEIRKNLQGQGELADWYCKKCGIEFSFPFHKPYCEMLRCPINNCEGIIRPGG